MEVFWRISLINDGWLMISWGFVPLPLTDWDCQSQPEELTGKKVPPQESSDFGIGIRGICGEYIELDRKVTYRNIPQQT